ncbi:hypothetical protein KY290_010262 [Solanum tuberosum]|uniref:Uncharacterized protein n=1 Tax=Solanum tuberosum TaxID=4113 RepID=A0ABQ7VXA1_SOLTU|nr:hypothetical protein KY284_014979 [Solanum tuberosum]KAH0705571.1 hypothetical protein KY289_010647 [Solanum tuberosum]KAH0718982.1 hypothetical protein KY285_015013 [Solanum tuberosum]KAH0773125.1 hypothetical protein KY290_010262 [Solanum tuberosum]
MRKEETSKQNKKGKGKQYVQAGTLTSMAYKRVSSLRSKESVQSILPRNSSTLVAQTLQKELRQVPQNSCTLKAQSKKDQMPQTQVVQEQVQPTPMNSSTVVAEVSENQLQHVPRESPTVEAHDIQYQVQQETQNSKENDLSGEQGPVTQKKKRGSTVMQSVHGRQERKLVVLNRYNQPIGPTNAIVTELGSFLGTLARNAMLCPLNIHNWKNMDTKKDLWDYTQEKYDIPDSAKNWALEGIRNARRKYRNDLYENHYKAYDNDDLRMANKPKDVSEFDFKDLLKYWDSEKFKEMSERNTKNRKKWMNPHTAGKTSFAVIRNNLEKEKESPDELSAKELFVATRSRKPGRVYKDSNEDTISKIAEMEKMQSRQNEDDNQSFDAFTTVMGHEHPGCLRLYGRGVTKSTLKRKALSEPYLSANDERMEKKWRNWKRGCIKGWRKN